MRYLILLLILCRCPDAAAHAIDYRVLDARGSTLEISYPGGRPFSFESYEVFGPGDASAFQIGRTDRLGRLTFLPDRPGDWTVKVYSDDGHGVQTVVGIAADLSLIRPRGDPLHRRAVGIAIGLLIIAVLGLALRVRSARRAP